MGPLLIERLRDACENRTEDGYRICDVHQVHNRCLTCQALAVIERYDRWFNANGAVLASHRIGGFGFGDYWKRRPGTMSATYYYARHNAELCEATRECDCSKPCQKVVKAEDYDAALLRLREIVAWFDVIANKYEGNTIVGEDWPMYWLRETRPLLTGPGDPNG